MKTMRINDVRGMKFYYHYLHQNLVLTKLGLVH